VRLPSADAGNMDSTALPLDELHPRELDLLSDMQPARKLMYAGGRLAIRRALRLAGAATAADAPILSTPSGAPAVFAGAMGSISHTTGLAAAYVQSTADHGGDGVGGGSGNGGEWWSRRTVGIDVESAARGVALKIATRVLAPEERATLGVCASMPEHADLLLRVSIKEALYKALHPLVRRPIRWHSVTVQPMPDGTCTVDVGKLEKQVGMRMAAEASWRLHEGYVVSTAAAWSDQRDGVVTPTGAACRGAAASAAAAEFSESEYP
jgi:4'-phosphopantetheinyl transferase EntD